MLALQDRYDFNRGEGFRRPSIDRGNNSTADWRPDDARIAIFADISTSQPLRAIFRAVPRPWNDRFAGADGRFTRCNRSAHCFVVRRPGSGVGWPRSSRLLPPACRLPALKTDCVTCKPDPWSREPPARRNDGCADGRAERRPLAWF